MAPDPPRQGMVQQNASPRHWYDAQPHPATNRSDAILLRWLVLILVFAAVVFALGHTMIVHHFFTGGALNNRASGGPTGP